jgi:hypothetical protein
VCVPVGVCLWGYQADGHCAGGVALAFLSLCVGKQLPSTLGLLCGISMDGHVMGEALTRGCLKAAREHGITTILASAMQVRPNTTRPRLRRAGGRSLNV